MSGAVYAKYSSLEKKENKVNEPPPCLEIQNLEHRRNLLKSNNVVCIDLYGHWCEPCKAIEPEFLRLAQEYNSSGRCLLAKENVDLELTRDININGVPAFIFYKMSQPVKGRDGKPVVVMGGDFKKIRHILDTLLTERQPTRLPQR